MQKVQTDEFKILLFGNTYISHDVGNWLCLVKRLRWATPGPSCCILGAGMWSPTTMQNGQMPSLSGRSLLAKEWLLITFQTQCCMPFDSWLPLTLTESQVHTHKVLVMAWQRKCPNTLYWNAKLLTSQNRKWKYFYAPQSLDQGHVAFALSVLLSVCLFFSLSTKKFNIGHKFWTVSDIASIFHMCILFIRPFL